MSQSIEDGVRWTTADIELLPDNGNRYEIIDGELFVARAPHWRHQKVIGSVFTVLDDWSEQNQSGQAIPTPGVIFTDADNVIPDVVWVSKERLPALVDDAGHLTGAPDLVVEVLSEGVVNQRRDREAKLKLYAFRGVQEYWILDWRLQQVEVYRRDKAQLKLVVTLLSSDELTSPLLPNLTFPVARLFR
ncbi:MAG: Uma2 family endonuclease [Lentisphaeria bacterium]|nr:Uma2 family endonuclease [Rivularia sp. ALOHA_DT_140]MCJ8330972.1 Uma2 family endonuclease [Lentisphaeria bacterium]NQZ68830.1 Uma2 family endonuclease [Lentisphaeria bacterium]